MNPVPRVLRCTVFRGGSCEFSPPWFLLWTYWRNFIISSLFFTLGSHPVVFLVVLGFFLGGVLGVLVCWSGGGGCVGSDSFFLLGRFPPLMAPSSAFPFIFQLTYRIVSSFRGFMLPMTWMEADLRLEAQRPYLWNSRNWCLLLLSF